MPQDPYLGIMDPDQVLLVLSNGQSTFSDLSRSITPWTQRVFNEMVDQKLVRMLLKDDVIHVVLTEDGKDLFRFKLSFQTFETSSRR